MTPVIPGFDYRRVPVANGVSLNVAVGGTGSPVVLLHGFPQTHLMWRHVAADLAAAYTVICPDLRGYGAGDKPAEAGPRDVREAHHGRRRRSVGPRAGT
jgi:haloacetate dehalogenase